jgi:bifunctional N-acetylglucosamine-1-phosphate-uridyltransferase/glucosamine-1-phosphate-acetyltransferase GlmU-like protein
MDLDSAYILLWDKIREQKDRINITENDIKKIFEQLDLSDFEKKITELLGGIDAIELGDLNELKSMITSIRNELNEKLDITEFENYILNNPI